MRSPFISLPGGIPIPTTADTPIARETKTTPRGPTVRRQRLQASGHRDSRADLLIDLALFGRTPTPFDFPKNGRNFRREQGSSKGCGGFLGAQKNSLGRLHRTSRAHEKLCMGRGITLFAAAWKFQLKKMPQSRRRLAKSLLRILQLMKLLVVTRQIRMACSRELANIFP